MDFSRRELLVARIASGSVRVRCGDRVFIVKKPTRDEQYEAAELYLKTLEEARESGAYEPHDLMTSLLHDGLWDDEREKTYSKLPKEIEDLKVALYESTFKSETKKVVRKALGVAKNKLEELAQERGCRDHLTPHGMAVAAKTRFLIGCGLHTSSGKRVYPDSESFWMGDSGLLDQVLPALASSRLTEREFRELARTEPWRSCWSAKSAEGSVFGVPSSDYTDEQRALAGWSGLYEGLAQHPSPPPDDVVEDDDCLDGWLIVQKRKRESGQAGTDEVVTNEKVRNCGEIMLPCETPEDARRVMNMNDSVAKATIASKFRAVEKHGTVEEQDLPDVKLRLMMERNQLEVANLTGGK